MLLFSFLQVFDYSASFFYKSEEHKVLHNFEPPSFKEWDRSGFENTTETITIPANTQMKEAPYFYKRIDFPNFTSKFIYIESPGIGPAVEGAKAYIDITGEDGKGHYWGFKYGALSDHCSSQITPLDNPINNSVIVHLSFYYINENPTKDAVFKMPTIHLMEPIIENLETTTKKVDGHKDMYIKTTHVTKEMGIIGLNAFPLKNAFKLPKTIIYPHMHISPVQEPYSRVFLLANATHILAYNILQEEYMHVWHISETVDYTTFEMNIRARNSTGADISYILWKVDTTSWTDAIEHWHEEFPEIYHVQPGGWGFWAPFPELNIVFPDSSDEIDPFHVGFQWGANYMHPKETVPNWCYIEPTFIHIDIPFNKDTYLDDIKTCKYDPKLNKTKEEQDELTLRCKAILKSGMRAANGSLIIEPEFNPWNRNGMSSPIFFDGYGKEYYIKKLNRTFYAPITYNLTHRFIGVGLDSFNPKSVTYIDEEAGYAPGEEFMPYFAADSHKRLYLPSLAGMFDAVKVYKEYSPRGIMINGHYIMPELLKYIANMGCEIRLVDESLDALVNPTYNLNLFWTGRYSVGSRSLSYVDNSHREISFKHKEEYFSIMASFGSASAYFSEDATTNNFWQNKSDIDYIRPFIKRWMPALNEAFNGNIFYANQLGLIDSEMPKEKQVPEISDVYDLSTTTLWCKPKDKAVDGWVDCYMVAFLGYCGPNLNGSNFHREAHIKVYGTDQKCLFVSNDMNCVVNDDGSVDVSIHGLPSYKTYRSSIIKFKRKLLMGYPDYYTPGNSSTFAFSISLASTLLFIGILLFAFYVHLRKLKRENLQNNPQNEDNKNTLNEQINTEA